MKKLMICIATIAVSALTCASNEKRIRGDHDCAFRYEADSVLCNNPQLSELDFLLDDVYQARLKSSQDPEQLEKEQADWNVNVRRACDGNVCLVKAYEQRIAVLGGQTPEKKNFMYTKPFYDNEVCQAYLNILNQTPFNLLKACQLPDLTDSPFQSLSFALLTGDELKKWMNYYMEINIVLWMIGYSNGQNEKENML